MASDQVALVKSKVDIVEVVGERVQLKKAGRNMKALCPFHGEKSPSFFVSPEMQTYKCFGCGVGGDAISFLQAYEGLEFPEALEILAKRAGVELKREFQNRDDKKRERGLEIMHLTAEFYQYLLQTHAIGKKARDYLYERQIPTELQRDFGLGYAPAAWETLTTYMRKKKYSIEELVEVGLAVKSSRGGYDRFRGRIMFPLKDFAGRVVGFSGRLLEKEAKEVKYINTPETKWYHKSHLLFGLDMAKKAIREKDRVIVVEGEMDVISSNKAKVKEIVAVKGTALTEEQVKLLRRLTNTIVLALDADEAGQEALRRAVPIVERSGMNLRVITIEGNKDPDDLVKEEPKLWREAVKGAVSVYRYYIDWAMKAFDVTTGEGIKRISQEVAPVLAKIENTVERAYYVKMLAGKLGVTEAVVEEEVRRVGVGQVASVEKEGGESLGKRRDRRELLERYVVSLLVHTRRGFGERLGSLEAEWFVNGYVKKVVERLRGKYLNAERVDLTKVRSGLPAEMLGLLQELYMEDQGLFDMSEEAMEMLWRRSMEGLKEMYLKERLGGVSRLMSSEEVSVEETKTLRDEYRKLMGQLKRN